MKQLLQHIQGDNNADKTKKTLFGPLKDNVNRKFTFGETSARDI